MATRNHQLLGRGETKVSTSSGQECAGTSKLGAGSAQETERLTYFIMPVGLVRKREEDQFVSSSSE